MPEYRRFIAYFYEYIDGKKRKNAGFAKVELRNGVWRILFRLTTGTCPEPPVRVYGFVREGGYLLGLSMGTLRSETEITEEWVYRMDVPLGRRYKFGDLAGIWIQSGEDRIFLTVWDEEPVRTDRFVLKLPEDVQTESCSVPGITLETAAGLASAPSAPDAETVPSSVSDNGLSADVSEAEDQVKSADVSGAAMPADAAVTVDDTKTMGVSGTSMPAGESESEKNARTAEVSEMSEDVIPANASRAAVPAEVSGTVDDTKTMGVSRVVIPADTAGTVDDTKTMNVSVTSMPAGESESENRARTAEVSEMSEDVIPANVSRAVMPADTAGTVDDTKNMGVLRVGISAGAAVTVNDTKIMGVSGAEMPAGAAVTVNDTKTMGVSGAAIPVVTVNDTKTMGVSGAVIPAAAAGTVDDTKIMGVTEAEDVVPAEVSAGGEDVCPVHTSAMDGDMVSENSSASMNEAASGPKPKPDAASVSSDKGSPGVKNREMDCLFRKRAQFRPFSDSEIINCVMLRPCDIVWLQQQGWQVGRSSFLQHGFYHYRHLLLGKGQDGSYILGVPGIRTPQEKYMAEMFGFGDFKMSKKYENNRVFGYWYRKLGTINEQI